MYNPLNHPLRLMIRTLQLIGLALIGSTAASAQYHLTIPDAPLDIVMRQAPEYTLVDVHRDGGVSAAVTVQLQSTDTNVFIVPKSTTFDVGEDTAQIFIRADNYGAGSLMMAAPGYLAEPVTVNILPPVSLQVTPSPLNIFTNQSMVESVNVVRVGAEPGDLDAPMTVTILSADTNIFTAPVSTDFPGHPTATAQTNLVDVTAVSVGSAEMIFSAPGIMEVASIVNIYPDSVFNLEIDPDPISIILDTDNTATVTLTRVGSFPGDLDNTLTVSLTSSDPGVFTVPAETEFTPTMATAQTNTFTVTGQAPGLAELTAEAVNAPEYDPVSAAVQVAQEAIREIRFQPESLDINLQQPNQTMQLIRQGAVAGDLDVPLMVRLWSSNQDIFTLTPTNIVFPATAETLQSVTLFIEAGSEGQAVLHAQPMSADYDAISADISVFQPALSLPPAVSLMTNEVVSVDVIRSGGDMNVPLTVSLSQPAGPDDYFDLRGDSATFQRNDTLTIPAGENRAAFELRGLEVMPQAVPLTASAPGYQSAQSQIRVVEVGDSNNDGIPDWWYREHFPELDPAGPSIADEDPDGDGISNYWEYRLGSDPHDRYSLWRAAGEVGPRLNDGEWDSDGDGLSNWEEIHVWRTDPTNPDTSDNGYTDGEELSALFVDTQYGFSYLVTNPRYSRNPLIPRSLILQGNDLEAPYSRRFGFLPDEDAPELPGPEITITQPADDADSDVRVVDVAGSVESDQTVTSTRLYLNDLFYRNLQLDADGAFSDTIIIGAGENIIEVVSINQEGGVGRSSVTVNGTFELADIRVTQDWSSPGDLDTWLIDPQGRHMGWTSGGPGLPESGPERIPGAFLDRDDIVGSGPENITIEAGNAIPGQYEVWMNNFSHSGNPLSTVRVLVREGQSGQQYVEFGPRAMPVSDGNSSNPEAWWHVTTITWPSGEMSPGGRTVTGTPDEEEEDIETGIAATDGWTIEGWVKPMDDGQSGALAAYRLHNDRLAYVVGMFENRPFIRVSSAMGTWYEASAAALPAGEWTHLAFVYGERERTVRVFVNGHLMAAQHMMVEPLRGEGVFTVDTAYTDPSSGITRSFDGCYLDEFRVWSRARNGGLIRNTMHRRVPVTPSLVAYYHFDDGGLGIEDGSRPLDRAYNLGGWPLPDTMTDAKPGSDGIWGTEHDIPAGAGPDGHNDYVTATRFAPVFGEVDQDGDGIADWWEDLYFGDPTGADAQADPDGDGLNNLYEYLVGTNPFDVDTNNDGIWDAYQDFDGDGLSNIEEQRKGTHPRLPDTADNGLLDGDLWDRTPDNSLTPRILRVLELDGNPEGYVEMPRQHRFAMKQSFTLMAWINMRESTGESHIIRRQVEGNVYNYALSLTADNKLELRFTPGDRSGDVVASSVMPISPLTNEWVHVAATFNHISGEMALFVDGDKIFWKGTVKRPQAGGVGPIRTRIGENFNGQIDHAGIFSTVLSESQIRAARESLLNQVEQAALDHLVSYYRFDDGTSATGPAPDGRHYGTSGRADWWWGQVEEFAPGFERDWMNQWRNAGTLYGDARMTTNIMEGAAFQPVETDSNADGIPDWWYLQYGLDPNGPSVAEENWDGTGIPNYWQYRLGADPSDPYSLWVRDGGDPDDPERDDDGEFDSDGDGLSNWTEIHLAGSDPLNPDTSNDGFSDGVKWGMSPRLDPRSSLAPFIPRYAQFINGVEVEVPSKVGDADVTARRFNSQFWTIEAWVRPDDMTTSDKQTIVANTIDGNVHFDLYIEGGSDIEGGSVAINAGGTELVNPEVLEPGRWYKVMARINDNETPEDLTDDTLDLWVGGTRVSRPYVQPPLNWTANSDLTIARTGDSTNRFEGGLTELRIWGRARTDAEIERWNNRYLLFGAPPEIETTTDNDGVVSVDRQITLGGSFKAFAQHGAYAPATEGRDPQPEYRMDYHVQYLTEQSLRDEDRLSRFSIRTLIKINQYDPNRDVLIAGRILNEEQRVSGGGPIRQPDYHPFRVEDTDYGLALTSNGLVAVVNREIVAVDESFSPSGDWQDLAMTFDGAIARIFVNGRERESGVASLDPAELHADGILAIGLCNVPNVAGGRGGGGVLFDAEIDETTLWSRPLTESQLGELTQTVLYGTEQGLVTYFDYSDVEMPPTPQGFPTFSDMQLDRRLSADISRLVNVGAARPADGEQADDPPGYLGAAGPGPAVPAIKTHMGSLLGYWPFTDGGTNVADYAYFGVDDFALTITPPLETIDRLFWAYTEDGNSQVTNNSHRLFVDVITNSFHFPLQDESPDLALKGDVVLNAMIADRDIYLAISQDADMDGLPTWWETAFNLDPNNNAGEHGAFGDPDGDGLWNITEYRAGTNPRDTNSKGGNESDGNLDSDGDELTNRQEQDWGTHPGRQDSDDDGFTDSEEIELGSDPLLSTRWYYQRALEFTNRTSGLEPPRVGEPGSAEAGRFNLQEWTVEMWVNPTDTDGNAVLLRNDQQNSDRDPRINYEIGIENGYPYVRFETPGGKFFTLGSDPAGDIAAAPQFGSAVTTLPPIPTNRWTHIAARMTGQHLDLFVHGHHYRRNVDGNFALYGDSDVALGSNFVGRLNEVRVWNYPRTDDEITLNAHQTLLFNDLRFSRVSDTVKRGAGLRLSGDNAFMQSVSDIGRDQLLPQFTLSLWVRTTDEDMDLIKFVHGDVTAQNVNAYNVALRMQGGRVVAGWRRPVPFGCEFRDRRVVSVNRIDDDVWHHVALTFVRGGNVVLYIDGQPESIFHEPVDPICNFRPASLIVGQNGAADIDEVSIWNVAQSSDWIANYYNRRILDNGLEQILTQPFRGDEVGLRYYFDFNFSERRFNWVSDRAAMARQEPQRGAQDPGVAVLFFGALRHETANSPVMLDPILGFASQLVAYWPFDDGGQTIEDFANRGDIRYYTKLYDDPDDKGQISFWPHDGSDPEQRHVHVVTDEMPFLADGDQDGLPDWWEVRFGTDPNSDRVLFFDPSTRTTTYEYEPLLDFSGGGLSTWYHYLVAEDQGPRTDRWIDPFLYDTANDGVPDGDVDSDGDGLTNLEEQRLGTHPGRPDTDDNNMADGDELDPERICSISGRRISNPLFSDSPQVRRALRLSGERYSIPEYEDVLGFKEWGRFALQDAWTIELWVKPENVAHDVSLVERETVTGETSFRLGLRDNRPYAEFDNPAGITRSIIADNVIPTNRWTHIAAVYSLDGRAFSLYIDGVVRKSLTTFDRIAGGEGWGNTWLGDAGFVGLVDHLRIWRVARSAAQINSNHRRTMPQGYPEAVTAGDNIREYAGFFYEVVRSEDPDGISFEEAKELAELRGGDLAIIEARQVDQFLQQWVYAEELLDAWIGLTYSDDPADPNWVWIDNVHLRDRYRHSSFQPDFQDGQPGAAVGLQAIEETVRTSWVWSGGQHILATVTNRTQVHRWVVHVPDGEEPPLLDAFIVRYDRRPEIQTDLVAWYSFDDGENESISNPLLTGDDPVRGYGAEDYRNRLRWGFAINPYPYRDGPPLNFVMDSAPVTGMIDSDDDGLPDWWEHLWFGSITAADAAEDGDGDGLSNLQEYLADTNPKSPEIDFFSYRETGDDAYRIYGELFTDFDGVPVAWEQRHGLDPNRFDSHEDPDGDGWSNLAEFLADSDPNDPADTPMPTISWDLRYHGNQANGDVIVHAYSTELMDGNPDAVFIVDAEDDLSFPISIETTTPSYGHLREGRNWFFAFIDLNNNGTWDPGEPAGIATYQPIDIRVTSARIPFAESMPDDPGVRFDDDIFIYEGAIGPVRIDLADRDKGFNRFGWDPQPAASSYRVELRNLSRDGAPVVLNRLIRAERNFVHRQDYLLAGFSHGLPNAAYQWFVYSTDPSTLLDSGSFIVDSSRALAAPTALEPNNHILRYALNEFTWDMVADATVFELQIARDDRFIEPLIHKTASAPLRNASGKTAYRLSALAGDAAFTNGVYYWRVRARSANAISDWSDPPRRFQIDLSPRSGGPYTIAGDLMYPGKVTNSVFVVQAFRSPGFGGMPVAQTRVENTSIADNWPRNLMPFELNGLRPGVYFVRAFLDQDLDRERDPYQSDWRRTPAIWETQGMIALDGNVYRPRALRLPSSQYETLLTTMFRDTDNDRLPDDWEYMHYGDLTTAADYTLMASHDGATHYEAYAAGRLNIDPSDPDATDADGVPLRLKSDLGLPFLTSLKPVFTDVERGENGLPRIAWNEIPGAVGRFETDANGRVSFGDGDGGLEYVVQFSADLIEWSDVSGTVTIAPDGDAVRFIPHHESEGEPGFYRLVVRW